MKIAMLGFGNIGTGFYNEIKTNYKDIEVAKVLVRDIKKTRAIESEKLTADFDEILRDASIGTIVDVTAGEASVKYITGALSASKNV
ncbi:MAG TPA: hypothetical protein PK467_01515 [Candidatus Wallbacteria bacterium]|nr:hypothetical protein [Candidatus Wallbacteria bacterium]